MRCYTLSNNTQVIRTEMDLRTGEFDVTTRYVLVKLVVLSMIPVTRKECEGKS